MMEAETRLCDHFRVQFLLLWVPWAGRQCRVPRRCLEENAGEREQNKRRDQEKIDGDRESDKSEG